MPKRFFQDEAGNSAVEYCLLMGLIAMAMTAAVTTLGTTLSSIFNWVATFFGG